jgi:hypothetical protein
VPVAGDRTGFKNWSGTLDLDQHHDRCGHRDRRCRVHHNAEWAMVCVGIHLVYVDNLHHRHKRQQDKTHQRDNPQGTWLCAAIPA